MAYEGKVYAPGATVAKGDLGPHAVVLECAGPQGMWKAGKLREVLYILWRWEVEGWREIARTQAYDGSWAHVLRSAAVEALNPKPAVLYDVLKRGRELAEEIIGAVDGKLEAEDAVVKLNAYDTLYTMMAARIAAGAHF